MPKPIANITYEVYTDSTPIPYTKSVELPNVQSKTISTSGAGQIGTADVVLEGNYENMTMKMTFAAMTDELALLTPKKYHNIEVWIATQTLDAATGNFVPVQQKAIMQACPQSTNYGTIAPGEEQNIEIDFHVIYYRLFFNGKEQFEIGIFTGTDGIGGNPINNAINSLIGR